MPKLSFKELNLIFSIKDGSELLEAKRLNPLIPLKFGCTRGDCGVCIIKILSGSEHLTKKCSKEAICLSRKNLSSDYRLACQCAINGDIVIE